MSCELQNEKDSRLWFSPGGFGRAQRRRAERLDTRSCDRMGGVRTSYVGAGRGTSCKKTGAVIMTTNGASTSPSLLPAHPLLLPSPVMTISLLDGIRIRYIVYRYALGRVDFPPEAGGWSPVGVRQFRQA